MFKHLRDALQGRLGVLHTLSRLFSPWGTWEAGMSLSAEGRGALTLTRRFG